MDSEFFVGLTWERLGLILGVGLLVSAAIFGLTQRAKRKLEARWPRAAIHFARLAPTVLGLGLGLALFPLVLLFVGVTSALEYSAQHLILYLLVGFVGGEFASTAHEIVACLRDYLPELVRKRT